MAKYVYTMRRVVGAAALCLALVTLPAAAQHIPRVGVLTFTTLTQDFRDAFTEGLRAEGYVEGRSIRIEWRSADGRTEQAARAAAELVGLKVDVIVASLTPAVQAAHKATRSIPIVMAPAGDPLQQGFAASLARPGGNITGLTGVELSAKRVELLREMVPGMKIMAGVDEATDGEVIRMPGINVGYLPQEPALDAAKTVREEVEAARSDVAEAKQQLPPSRRGWRRSSMAPEAGRSWRSPRMPSVCRPGMRRLERRGVRVATRS